MKKIIVSLFITSSFLFSVELGKNYQFKNGEEAFQKVCSYCHNIGIAPKSIFMKMEGKDGIEARRDSIIYVVRHGLNAMPSFRKTEISDEVLKDLATKLANGTITQKGEK